MVSHSCSHDVPVGERGKKCEAIECILGQIKNIPYLYVFYGKQWMVTGPFDLKSFRYKSFDTYLFSRVVNSFTYLSLRTKNIFTHNVFLVHAQTILEVIEILVQFHYLSSYRNNLYRNDLLPNEYKECQRLKVTLFSKIILPIFSSWFQYHQ